MASEKTVSKHFNDPLYIDVLGITKDFLQPGQNYNKMYGTEFRFNESLVIMNTFQKRKRNLIYLDITNTEMWTCDRTIAKEDCQTSEDKIYVYRSLKQFCLPVLVFLVP